MPSDESKGSQLDAIGSLAQRQLDNTDQRPRGGPFECKRNALRPDYRRAEIRRSAQRERGSRLPWCINTGKSLIPLTLRFLAQKRNLLIPLELSRVMHQGIISPTLNGGSTRPGIMNPV